MNNTDKPIIRCAACSVERATGKTKDGALRVPNGWGKKPNGEIVCGACWDRIYVLRAISLAVAEPVGSTWEDFDAVCRNMWRMTTQACNWIATELYTRDVRRTVGGPEKMPPMPKVYLYPELRAQLPDLPSQTVAALLNSITAKYRAIRYEVVWKHSAALPTFRYPSPFPAPAQGWSLERDETDQRFVVSVRIGDQRWQLRLAGGARYRRQTEALANLVADTAVPGEMALYRQHVDGKDRTMVKLVAYLPRSPRAARNDAQALIVRTDPDSLLVALNRKDEKVWTYNADHLRRWSAEHREQLQRWSDDSKYEQRPIPLFSARREVAAVKYRARMDSAVNEIAAQLVGYAERRRFTTLEYRDKDTSYLPAFPWFLLRERISIVCDERGIEFTHASGEVVQISS